MPTGFNLCECLLYVDKSIIRMRGPKTALAGLSIGFDSTKLIGPTLVLCLVDVICLTDRPVGGG